MATSSHCFKVTWKTKGPAPDRRGAFVVRGTNQLVGADFVDFHESDSSRIARAADDGRVSTWFEPNQERRFQIIPGRQAARDDIGDIRVRPPIVIRSELIAPRVEGEQRIRQRRRDPRRRKRRSHGADHYELRSASNDEAADKLALASSNQTTRRDVRHMMEHRALKRVHGECSGTRLEHSAENALGDHEAARYRAGAADRASERERVWSRRRCWRRYRSKSTAQQRPRALNHDDVLVRIDDEHHLTFAGRPVRDAEVTTRDRGIRAERAEAGCLEWLPRQGKRDAVFARGSDDCLAGS